MAAGAFWPAASAKITGDTYFAGADLGTSIDLGGGRVLWLFGDTFARTTPGQARASTRFIRNSIAIQSGSYDLSQATLTFYCGGGGMGSSTPASFFPERAVDGGAVWNWFGSGLLLDDVLVLFAGREEPYPQGPPGFQFKHAGWDAVLIDNPDVVPTSWQLNYLQTPSDFSFTPACVQEGGDGWVYALGFGPKNEVRAIRWDRDEMKAGQLMSPQRWGRCGWQPWSSPGPWRSVYTPPNAGSNSGTLWLRPDDFAFLQMPAFSGLAQFGYSLSGSRVGPFGPLSFFYQPYGDDPMMSKAANQYVVYAGAAHPEQVWPGKTLDDVMVTSVIGAAGGNSVLSDEGTYYVRCAKVTGLT